MCTNSMYNPFFIFVRYNIQRTTSWGYLRNGSFDGLVGALQRKESDIGGTSVFFRRDRFKYIDYAAETWGSRQVLMQKSMVTVSNGSSIWLLRRIHSNLEETNVHI